MFIGVEPIRQTLGVPASAYYQRATGLRSPRSLEDEPRVAAHLLGECVRAPRLQSELRQEGGEHLTWRFGFSGTLMQIGAIPAPAA